MFAEGDVKRGQAVSHAEPGRPIAGLVSGVAQGILEGRACQAAGLHPGAGGLANLASAAGMHAQMHAGELDPSTCWCAQWFPWHGHEWACQLLCRALSEAVPAEQRPGGVALQPLLALVPEATCPSSVCLG